jgi:hypothetical protein
MIETRPCDRTITSAVRTAGTARVSGGAARPCLRIARSFLRDFGACSIVGRLTN